MIDKALTDVYTKFKLYFYQQVFGRFAQREATLTTVETFCMEVIMALGHPTIAEFSNMMHISTPNAAYKVNSLVRKGYVKRVRSEEDRREFTLHPTDRYMEYYNINQAYVETVAKRIKERFSPEEVKLLDRMLSVVGAELMPEVNLTKGRGSRSEH